ncbi:MAG: hypothetical protein WC979_05840 [Candidatus Pacearchaeota archaeon]|jgi:hypothetical protein
MDFKGIIIEESLKDTSVLKAIKIVKTVIEKTTERHRTPWLTQWTIHNVEISEEKIDKICERLQKSLDPEHEWYIDLKNNKYEISIFRDEVTKKRIYHYNFN